jgi:hypothetical protein
METITISVTNESFIKLFDGCTKDTIVHLTYDAGREASSSPSWSPTRHATGANAKHSLGRNPVTNTRVTLRAFGGLRTAPPSSPSSSTTEGRRESFAPSTLSLAPSRTFGSFTRNPVKKVKVHGGGDILLPWTPPTSRVSNRSNPFIVLSTRLPTTERSYLAKTSRSPTHPHTWSTSPSETGAFSVGRPTRRPTTSNSNFTSTTSLQHTAPNLLTPTRGRPVSIPVRSAVCSLFTSEIESIMVKKRRCTCCRCAKVKYLPATGIDTSERFLCESCDDRYITWCNSQAHPSTATLDAFLKARPYIPGEKNLSRG